jgi:putative transposase
MDAWAYAHDVPLEFIRRGKPIDNAFTESFNSRLRDECLNVLHIFGSTIDAQRVLDDYNYVRPRCALQDRTPVEMGTMWVDSRLPRESTAARKDQTETEIAGRFVTISH